MDQESGDRRGRIIKIDPQLNLEDAVKCAAKVLRAGGLVGYPTESFYGLGVDAINRGAIRRLFSLKERSGKRPILILIHSEDTLYRYVRHVPPVARQLIDAFWPGPLTLVFEASPVIPALLTGGTGKIGVRLSGHPVARALSRAVGGPVTGTSANISGKPPPTSAAGVWSIFGKRLDLILDGGKAPGKKGSTILDVTTHPPRVLRRGLVLQCRLKQVTSLTGTGNKG